MSGNKALTKILLILFIQLYATLCKSQVLSDTTGFLYIKCDTTFKSDTIKVDYAVMPDESGFLKVFHPKQFIHNYKQVKCDYLIMPDNEYPFSQYVIDGKTIRSETIMIYKESKSKYVLTNF